MTLTPTPEQEAIIEAGRTTQDNLLVSALAGAAKTSTLVMLAKAVPVQTLCLAFNKKIATEMQERLPLHCTSKTLNALGHAAWGKTIGKRLTLEYKKNYNILKAMVDQLSGDAKAEAYSMFSDLLNIIEEGKTGGWVPSHGGFSNAKPLLTDEEFFASLDEELEPWMERLVVAASVESINQGFKGVIDFNDQILLPTVFSSPFDSYPLVMIDEAQDLSPLNHVMLRKVARKRLIAVGDACQAIYGFRGASENSMTELQQQFNMRELHLTISFRCPIAVVEEARWRAPIMKWPEWAKPGLVTHAGQWNERLIPDYGVILCRNNAPLFSMAIALLRRGRYPELVGNDIGKALIKQLKKFGPESMPQASVITAIKEWESAKLAKARTPGRIVDQAACLKVFADAGDTLGAAIAYAERIMAQTGPVKLMTIHKSKGLEFDHVFILDQHLIRKDQQDLNLKYVAQTRAKETLTYINSSDLEEIEEDK